MNLRGHVPLAAQSHFLKHIINLGRSRRMKAGSKIIVMIASIVILAVAIICSDQNGLVTASSKSAGPPLNVPGPSQFYAQHNLISDGFIPADQTDSNLVNAWGLVAGPNTPWWISDN